MQRAGVWLISSIYLVYLLIYFGGKDGTGEYFWVNNDFFFSELLIAAVVVTVVVLFNSYGVFRSRSERERSFADFKGFFYCLALTVLFVPFAFALALVDYASDF